MVSAISSAVLVERSGCVVEDARAQIDTYLNHMVRSVHEFRLLERGDETPRMDDPSHP